MPMLDVYIPDGALQPDAEAALLNRITEILVRNEGFNPADPVSRSVSWLWLHRRPASTSAENRGRTSLQGRPVRPRGPARRAEACERHRRGHRGNPRRGERRLAA